MYAVKKKIIIPFTKILLSDELSSMSSIKYLNSSFKIVEVEMSDSSTYFLILSSVLIIPCTTSVILVLTFFYVIINIRFISF